MQDTMMLGSAFQLVDSEPAPTPTDEWEALADLMLAKIIEWADERGLSVTGEIVEQPINGPTRKVYCREAKGLWLNSFGGLNTEGCVGVFEVQYQHCDSELKLIRDALQEVLSLQTTIQWEHLRKITHLLDAVDETFA